MLIPVVADTQASADWVQRTTAIAEWAFIELKTVDLLRTKDVVAASLGPLFRAGPCIVGPLTIDPKVLPTEKTIALVIEMLDRGARYVLLRGNVSKEFVESIFTDAGFRRRILVEIPCSQVDGCDFDLGVGGYIIKCEYYEEATVDKVSQKLLAASKKTEETLLAVRICFFGDVSSRNAEKVVGVLHKMKQDFPVHLVCHLDSAPEDDDKTVDGNISLVRAFWQCLTPTREGLVPTGVVDEFGIALGLVHSSLASLCEAVACRRGVYWSRSRNALWRKGDDSGAEQRLISIRMDCDGDALRFKVEQKGSPPAFCHRNSRSCWGDSGGIAGLFLVLQDRKNNAPDASYTKRLFRDSDLLRSKLREEAGELSEALDEYKKQTEATTATKNNIPGRKLEPEAQAYSARVAEEAGDVIYFTLAVCIAGGVTLADVTDVLDRRALHVTRRKGDAKPV